MLCVYEFKMHVTLGILQHSHGRSNFKPFQWAAALLFRAADQGGLQY